MSNLELIVNQNPEEDRFQQIASEDVLAPGYFWRLKNNFSVENPTWKNHPHKLRQGDIHLLLDIFENDGVAHTATILCHPRDGSNTEYKILIADFLANFEPEKDADAIRAKEQADVMLQVQDVQSDIETAQINPLALPSMKDAVDKAMEKFEQDQVALAHAEEKTQVERTTDLRKLHRRAARRSEAAGNPLTVRSATISDQVGVMIAGGIDSQGLVDLTFEAKRRIVVAEATAKWLMNKTGEISEILRSLTPYYAEKGKVALARANKAITYVKKITQGLNSLKLYTGDGVDVVSITEGKSALSIEPLTLAQGKRFMDEELAVWADVSEHFDWKDQSRFFEALKTTPSLVDQIFPTARCVVSMAVTRRDIGYSSKEMSSYEIAMNEIRNRTVFLLIRDGENIHAVYSNEPSHEAAHRLFPTQAETEKPFNGVDGSKIGLKDIAFSASVKRFDDVALHYKRFLILLCGLDHRMKLLGDFYPVEQSMNFMTMDFQSRYFRFLSDDDSSFLIGDGLESVDSWMTRCNKAIKSGSRIVMTSGGLESSSPQLKRSQSSVIDYKNLPRQHIVTRTKNNHCITVETVMRLGHWGDAPKQNTATVWLDGSESAGNDWYLCMDLVRLADVRRYIYSRISRISSIKWIRAFKRAETVLMHEEMTQRDLRAMLSRVALENKILKTDEVSEAIEQALSAWRAAHRGIDAPDVSDTKSVNEILTLMFPSSKIVQSTQSLVDALIERLDVKPLFMTRTGKNKLYLYAEASEQEKAPFGTGVHWGWVKRLQIDILKTKASVNATSFVWLEKDKRNADEEVVREWNDYACWLHACAAPCTLKSLEFMKTQMQDVESHLTSLLARGRGHLRAEEIPEDFFEEIILDAQYVYSTMKYCSDVNLVLPIGIYQNKEKSTNYFDNGITDSESNKNYHHTPVFFMYAKFRAYEFVLTYGSDKQKTQYKEEVLKYFPPKAMDKLHAQEASKWVIIQTNEPFKKCILDSDAQYKYPSLATIRSHKCGGIKRKNRSGFFLSEKSTRAERRAKGGNPCHEACDFTLSWNRAIEAIIGIAPHLKRNFHKDYWNKRDKKVYTQMSPLFDLSNLIWNSVQNRSIANRYFSF